MNFNERTLLRSGSSMPDPTPIVYVVDDDVSVRESLELLLRWAGWQPKIFASAQDFLSRPLVDTPSCLLLDIELPGLNGLELQERIAANRSEMPIIFITGHGDIPTAVRAMKAGADEFLTKPFADDVLLEAIRRAIERNRGALGQAAELKLLRERYASLTRRERDVMTRVVAGLANKEVAAELGRSEITIKAHRGKVMQKMQAASLADLVRMAARLNVTPAPKG
jgi:FixJ family two-component response regulator